MLSLTLIAFLLATAMLIWGPSSTLDQKLYYSRDTAYALLSSLGPLGRARYQIIELVDFGLIAIYSAALRLAYVQVATKRPTRRWLAFAPGAMDLLETGGILVLLHAYPFRAPFVETLVVTATLAKWILATFALAWLVWIAKDRLRTSFFR